MITESSRVLAAGTLIVTASCYCYALYVYFLFCTSVLRKALCTFHGVIYGLIFSSLCFLHFIKNVFLHTHTFSSYGKDEPRLLATSSPHLCFYNGRRKFCCCPFSTLLRFNTTHLTHRHVAMYPFKESRQSIRIYDEARRNAISRLVCRDNVCVSSRAHGVFSRLSDDVRALLLVLHQSRCPCQEDRMHVFCIGSHMCRGIH